MNWLSFFAENPIPATPTPGEAGNITKSRPGVFANILNPRPCFCNFRVFKVPCPASADEPLSTFGPPQASSGAAQGGDDRVFSGGVKGRFCRGGGFENHQDVWKVLRAVFDFLLASPGPGVAGNGFSSKNDSQFRGRDPSLGARFVAISRLWKYFWSPPRQTSPSVCSNNFSDTEHGHERGPHGTDFGFDP